MNERRWAPVPGWPNYDVSDDGMIRTWLAPPTMRRRDAPRARSVYFDREGYSRIDFEEKINGVRRREKFLVHRLVAMCFVEGDQSLHVAHLDGNPLNCHYSNLKWVTRKENESHKVLHGRTNRGKEKLLCDRAVRAIVKLKKCGNWRSCDLAELFEISPQSISLILRGRTWKHVKREVTNGIG